MGVFTLIKTMIFIVSLCILSVYSEPTLDEEGVLDEGKENSECSCNNNSSSYLLQKATVMQVCCYFFDEYSNLDNHINVR